MNIDQKIGAAIRARRIVLGLSQDKIAKSMGITFQQIQKYEKGINSLNMERLQQIAKALSWNMLSLLSHAEVAVSFSDEPTRASLENIKRLNMLKKDEKEAVTAFLNILCRGREAA